MVIQNITINDIVDSEKFIIADTSGLTNGHHFPKYFMSVLNYSLLDDKRICDFINNNDNASEILERLNVRTIPGVSRELKRVGKSFDKMWKRINSNGKISSDKVYLNDLLHEAKRSLERVGSLSNKSELEFYDQKYELLVHMLTITNNQFNIKKVNRNLDSELSKANRSRSYHGPRISNDTDERLVAAVLYCSMNYDCVPALLTRDRHFFHLFRHGPGILGSRTFVPFNSEFYKSIKYKGYKLYFGADGVWYPPNDNKDIFWWSRERMEKNAPHGIGEYLSEMHDSWQKFRELPSLEIPKENAV